MNVQEFQKLKIPTTPGVYMFIQGRGKPLYIGKATNLRSRVRSYFDKKIAFVRSPIIARVVEKAKTVRVIPTDSALEALLLEAQMIKKHQPEGNVEQKDDKSWNYVVITKEEFPRVLLMRGKEVAATGYFFKKKTGIKTSYRTVFGPFSHSSSLKEALRIVRKIFPFRDTCVPFSGDRLGKSCFNAHIGLCPGVCAGLMGAEDYARNIRHIELFFSGKKSKLISDLKKQMKECAQRLEFEKAAAFKKQLAALKHIRDVALIKEEMREIDAGTYRIEAYDVAHLSGGTMVGAMSVVSSGTTQSREYRMFKIKGFTASNDTGALREILERRLGHPEWRYPHLIVVDGGKAQKNAAEAILEKVGVLIPIIAVTKDEYHRPKKILGDSKIIKRHEHDILLANSEAHRFAIRYHKKLRSKDFTK